MPMRIGLVLVLVALGLALPGPSAREPLGAEMDRRSCQCVAQSKKAPPAAERHAHQGRPLNQLLTLNEATNPTSVPARVGPAQKEDRE